MRIHFFLRSCTPNYQDTCLIGFLGVNWKSQLNKIDAYHQPIPMTPMSMTVGLLLSPESFSASYFFVFFSSFFLPLFRHFWTTLPFFVLFWFWGSLTSRYLLLVSCRELNHSFSFHFLCHPFALFFSFGIYFGSCGRLTCWWLLGSCRHLNAFNRRWK